MEVLQKLEERRADPNLLIDMSAQEIGALCNNKKYGQKILTLASSLPHLDVTVTVQPITRGILRVLLVIKPDFEWSDRYHGYSEPFYLWIEDGENEFIYHSEYLLLQKKMLLEDTSLEFTIPIREPVPRQYFLKVISDRW